MTEQSFDRQFNLNVRGTFFTVQKALPLFADGGSIILNGSIVGRKGVAANSVYGASKAAVRSFARTWLVELTPRKIRVNVLSPGPIDTPALATLGEEARKYFESVIPMGRLGRPEEIASAALFRPTIDSSFITGSELCLDGGTAQI